MMSHSAFKGSSCASPSDRSGGRQDFSFLPPRTLSLHKDETELGQVWKRREGSEKRGKECLVDNNRCSSAHMTFGPFFFASLFFFTV